SRRARDTAKTRFDVGDAPRLEVLQAELAFAAAENEATAVDGLTVAARSRLNALLGQPLDTAQPLSTPSNRPRPRSTPAIPSSRTPRSNWPVPAARSWRCSIAGSRSSARR